MLSIGVKVEFYNIGLYCTNILQMQALKTKYVTTMLSFICNIIYKSYVVKRWMNLRLRWVGEFFNP